MKKVAFIFLNILLSFNVLLPLLFLSIGAIIFWVASVEDYMYFAIILIIFLCFVIKLAIFPLIYEHQKKVLVAESFFQKLKTNKRYKTEILTIAGILDVISLFINIWMFQELGILIFVLLGGGVLTSYLTLLVWFEVSNTKYKKLFVVMFFALFITGLLLILGIGFSIYDKGKDLDTNVLKYHQAIQKIKKDSKINGMSHFPQKIPENAQNYYFKIEDAFDGYDTHYVKFDADKTYIDSIIKKSKCEILASKNDINKYNVNIYSSELQNADEICILHKSTQKERYTSGISVYNDTKTIYFFYSNF